MNCKHGISVFCVKCFHDHGPTIPPRHLDDPPQTDGPEEINL